jgi:hypothetical protein
MKSSKAFQATWEEFLPSIHTPELKKFIYLNANQNVHQIYIKYNNFNDNQNVHQIPFHIHKTYMIVLFHNYKNYMTMIGLFHNHKVQI